MELKLLLHYLTLLICTIVFDKFAFISRTDLQIYGFNETLNNAIKRVFDVITILRNLIDLS
nr:hypothetical protein [Mycoplasmopsis bovis]